MPRRSCRGCCRDQEDCHRVARSRTLRRRSAEPQIWRDTVLGSGGSHKNKIGAQQAMPRIQASLSTDGRYNFLPQPRIQLVIEGNSSASQIIQAKPVLCPVTGLNAIGRTISQACALSILAHHHGLTHRPHRTTHRRVSGCGTRHALSRFAFRHRGHTRRWTRRHAHRRCA
jgi:hypothetical protein